MFPVQDIPKESWSVGRQVTADAPVGVFLSGGIDSGILTALYTQVSPQPPHTYTIAIEGDDFDLLKARNVAAYWNTKHREVIVSSEKFSKLIV